MALYTPPTWKRWGVLEGSLKFSVPTCFLVYRQGGVWHSVQTPGADSPVVKNCDTEAATGQFLFFTTPTVVSSAIAAELVAFGQGTIA